MSIITKQRVRGPRHFSDKEFRRVEIELIDQNGLWFRCLTCGSIWSPNIQSGGRLPRGYWKCPEGRCNG